MVIGDDAKAYASQARAVNIPVLGDDDAFDGTSVSSLPWDGRPIKKCLLLPDRTIAKCISGHGDDEVLFDYIEAIYSENQNSLVP